MALESLYGVDLGSLLTNPWFLVFVLVTAAWKFAWYGLVLWKNIQEKNKKHFIIFLVLMMVVNDLGIIPIVYLMITQKKKAKK